MGRPTQATTLKWSRSMGSSSIMDDAVPELQRAIDEIIFVAGPVSKDVEVTEAD